MILRQHNIIDVLFLGCWNDELVYIEEPTAAGSKILPVISQIYELVVKSNHN